MLAARRSLSLIVGRTSVMHSPDISKIIRAPLFRAGIAVQCFSATLIAAILLAIRLQWIDIVSIGLEGGIDEPSPKLEALHWGVLGLVLAFSSGFALYALAFYRQRNAQPGGTPNGGPATPSGNSGVAEGPPSVT